jgi:hypothetical protein
MRRMRAQKLNSQGFQSPDEKKMLAAEQQRN